jgi:hypothetical protein
MAIKKRVFQQPVIGQWQLAKEKHQFFVVHHPSLDTLFSYLDTFSSPLTFAPR